MSNGLEFESIGARLSQYRQFEGYLYSTASLKVPYTVSPVWRYQCSITSLKAPIQYRLFEGYLYSTTSLKVTYAVPPVWRLHMQYRQPYMFGLSTGIQICLGNFSYFFTLFFTYTYDSIGRAYIMYTRVWKLSTKRTLYINPFNTTYLYKKNVCKQCRPQMLLWRNKPTHYLYKNLFSPQWAESKYKFDCNVMIAYIPPYRVWKGK